MPTYDGGHYFLTVLAPITTGSVPYGSGFTSTVNALREQLALLPVAAQRPLPGRQQSPFARNTRNHFLRAAIIDDVAYNGREQTNVVWMFLKNIDPTVPQPRDHLSCPFLFLGVDFDAASGADSERDSYLAELWDTMESELRGIFTYCEGFDGKVTGAASFAKYIAQCQIETTMPFNDYYVYDPQLPSWPWGLYAIPAVAGAAVLVLGIAVSWLFSAAVGLFLVLAGAATAGAVIWRAYASIMAAGERPYPAAPDSTLPAVLKALHLQGAFARFAIDTQAVAASESKAGELHAAFGTFLANNRPENVEAPTQSPGVYGI
ncbi:MAG: hypothetical protein L0Y57_06740 [Beijerinckiaceae bacterium]|nr:hypothetical protein [Beijerinckiaceae bacterium]